MRRSKKNRIQEEIVIVQSPLVATEYSGKGEMSTFDSEDPLLQ